LAARDCQALFSERLAAEIRRKRTPVLVGLDPRWESLPAALVGDELTGSAVPVELRAKKIGQYCREIIDVVAPLVPAVKPQVAFFEMLGPAGMAELSEVIAYARRTGLLVVVDAKRNDIGSTAAAYAAAYFGAQAAWPADALTISPYLGDDSLSPFIDAAKSHDGGVFILVKTSNPGGGQFQDLNVVNQSDSVQKSLYRLVAEYVEEQAKKDAGPNGYGSVGAVVGATYPEQLVELRSVMPHAWLLVPGYGSQGGAAADVAGAFDSNGLGAIVNNSRGIIQAYQSPKYSKFAASQWQSAVESATRDMIADLQAHTSAGKLL
jgi:orotidine-5'-phosphate decarboxylase